MGSTPHHQPEATPAPHLPADDYDRHLEALASRVHRIERVVADVAAARRSVIDDLRGFLAEHPRASTGRIMVKTSTASLRDIAGEPDIELIDLVLAEVAAFAEPEARIVLADGPAFAADYHEIAAAHGWTELAERHGATVVDLNLEGGKAVTGSGISLSTQLFDSDLIVSLTKAKTHRRTGISGAEKASLGYLVGEDMGYPKLERRHYLIPRIYAAVAEHSPPTFHVLDGIAAIEGEGPLRGQPSTHEFMIHGTDPTALDVELARRYSFDPALVISLLHSLPQHHAAAEPGRTAEPTVVTVTENSPSPGRPAIRPARSQAWLYRSLRRTGSRRSRRSFRRIHAAFVAAEAARVDPEPSAR